MPSTRIKLLEQAMGTFGAKVVAKELATTEETLRIWIDGFASMPNNKFLRLADLLDRNKKD